MQLWLLMLPVCAALLWPGVAATRRFADGASLLPAQLAWRKVLCIFAALAFGFLWAAAFAHLRLAERLAPALEGKDLEVVGVVSSLPAATERGLRFQFDLETSAPGLPRRAWLAWYRSPLAEEGSAPLEAAVHPGERWLFTVRLRLPQGHLNPHGFDYEAWLMERGIGATGYVRARGAQHLLGHRDSLADRVEQVSGNG